MRHRIAVAAIAAAALIAAACQDSDGSGRRLSTEPGSSIPDAAEHYVTTAQVSVIDRVTHRLTTVEHLLGGHTGVSASIVNGSGNLPAMLITGDEPGVARGGGYGMQKYTDSGKHVHTIVMLYRSTGGPPAAMQHYIDGALVSTSAYAWQKTTAGWVRTQSFFQELRNGALIGTYSTHTAPAPPGGGGGPVQTVRLEHPARSGPFERAAVATMYGLAFAFAPQRADAQLYFPQCAQEWLHYLGAAAILTGTAATMLDAPVLTPMLIGQFISALAATAAFEDQLLLCILSHSQAFQNGMSGSGGGTGGGAPQGKSECLNGGYAGCTVSTVK